MRPKIHPGEQRMVDGIIARARARLSPREVDVLMALVAEFSIDATAEWYGIKPSTVRSIARGLAYKTRFRCGTDIGRFVRQACRDSAPAL